MADLRAISSAAPAPDAVSDYLSIQQAAARFNLSESTIRRAVKRGHLRYGRVSAAGAYRFRPEWVADYLDRNGALSEAA